MHHFRLGPRSHAHGVGKRGVPHARDQVNLLMKELTAGRAELRARDARIADLASQLEDHRCQLATVIARTVARNRAVASKK